MIIPTMTEGEVVKEVTADYFNAFRYSDHIDKKFRRIVIKSHRFPVRAHYEYISPRKNKWLIFLESRSKKEILDNSRVSLVATYETKIGRHAIMGTFTNKRMHFVIYPPHFFARYRQRVLQSDASNNDIIVRYFQENYSYVYDLCNVKISDNQYQIEVRGSTSEGVALGLQTVEGNVLFKTFVTYEMLKGEQIAIFTENEKIRKEIHG
jgi:hypothetical protein